MWTTVRRDRKGGVVSALGDEHGIALPTALIALMLLTSLLVAFTVLSKSEPSIASNQARATEARVLAEAGIERAMWALSTSTVDVSTAPYDGSTYVSLGTVGGFFVTVANGTASNERNIDAVGWSPSNSTAPGTAHRHLHVTVSKLKWLDPPAPIAVRGELKLTGSASADARQDSSCGNKGGTFATGTIQTTGGARSYGYGDDIDSHGSPDRVSGVPTSTFDSYIFTDSDLDTLRSLAKSRGTYLKGNQAFNSSNPLPNGLIFVDTDAGTNISCTGSGDAQVCTPSTFPTVQITGNAAQPDTTEWAGWLVVNGTINWSGNTRGRGFLYAVNDISFSGSETLYGAVVSRNIRDTSSTNVDSDLTGTALVQWDCSGAKDGAGTLPTGWFVKGGTYREVSD